MSNRDNEQISGWLIAMLIFLTTVSLASMSMFLPSLGVMTEDFGVGYDTMAWVVSGYLLLAAIVQVLVGPFADRLGRRPVLVFCICLFVVASVGCALSMSFAAFLAFRITQGAIITGLVLSGAIVSDIVGRQKAASILGYISMAVSLVPLVGPMTGGFLAELAGWRTNFWVYSGLGVTALALVWSWLPETGKKTDKSPGAFAATYFELLGNPLVWGYTLVMALCAGTFFIFISGVPLIAARQFALNQFEIGLAMGSMPIGFLFGSFLSGRISTRFATEKIILSGTIAASLGLLACSDVFWAGRVNPWTLLSGTMLVGLGHGLAMPNANASVMFVRKELAASASGLCGAAIAMFGAVFSAMAGYMLNEYPNAPVLVSLMMMTTIVSLAIAIWLVRKSRQFADRPV